MNEQPASQPQTDRTKPALDRSQRRIAWIALRVVLAAIVISLIMAAILTRSWTPFILAFAVGVPYILLISAPVWIARISGGEEQIKKRSN